LRSLRRKFGEEGVLKRRDLKANREREFKEGV
jgi:hypothetical protein